MDEAKLRAWWWHRQGLDGRLQGAAPATILEQTGWARSVGGVGPYLTLYARGGVRREAADAAVKNLAIHELPSTRGCTYVVPERDYALALQLSQSFEEAEMRTARKLGVTDGEIEKLCEAVVRALGKKALEPEQVREATGGASRSLGEEGKKKGLTTTLPLALGWLQTRGEIRRVAVNGRLDQTRYRYVRWDSNPLAGRRTSIEEAYTELARRYFEWIGPATLGEFQWFSGLGAKAAKAAVGALGLEALEAGGERLLLPEQRASFEAFALPKTPQYRLVSGLDGLLLLRRDVKGLLSGDILKTHAAMGRLSDLENHAIVDRGAMVGLWEYDLDTDSIAWMSLDGKKPAALRAAVAETEAYIREDLGDARSFSLDSPKSRKPRIAALRANCAG